MNMLKVQVGGKGLIPRGYGIAPRKDLINVTDINFLYLLVNTIGLEPKFLNPENNKLENITKKNMKSVWDRYANYIAPVPEVDSTSKEKGDNKKDEKPSQQVEKKEQPVPDPEETNDEEVEEIVEEESNDVPGNLQPAGDDGGLKPITSDRNKNQNNQNKKKH